MDDLMKKARERFYSEFTQMYSKAEPEKMWSKDCVETMKNLLKCVYYCDVLEAMHSEDNGESYDGGYSGARRRNAMGQFSRNGSYSGNYGGNYSGAYPMMMSGRRGGYSYDDERRNAMDRLMNLMNNESNNEVRMAIQSAMDELSMR